LPGRGAAPAARPLSSSGSIPLPLKASTSTAIRTKVPDEEGDLAAVSPTRVFCRLAAAAETGLLIVKCSAIRKEVFLVDGAPEFVSSNLASELLGEYLVSKGVISSGELSMALAMMPQFGNKLGNALVGLSLLRPLELFRLLTQQVRDKLIDVYTWTKGSYRYYRGERTTQEAFPLGLNIYEVTGAGVMAIPEPVLRARFESVLDSVPRIVPNPQLDPESFHISELLQQAVALLDNQRTIRELYEAGSTPEKQERFLRTLYLLVESELATLNRPW
jgi:serine/threonine-protein kinase